MRVARTIPDRLESRAARTLRSWEALLVLVAVAVFAINALASPHFLNPWNLSDATFKHDFLTSAASQTNDRDFCGAGTESGTAAAHGIRT